MNKTSSEIWLEDPLALFSSTQIIPTENMCLANQINAISRLVFILYIIMILFDFPYSVHFLIISLLVLIILYYIQRNNMTSKNEPYIVENYGYGTLDSSSQFKTGSSREIQSQPSRPAPRTVFAPSNQPYNMGNLTTSFKTNLQSNLNSNLGKGSPQGSHSSYSQQQSSGENGFETTLLQTPDQLAFCGDYIDTDNPDNPRTGLNQRLAYLPEQFNEPVQYNPVTKINPVVVPPTHALDYWKENEFIVYSKTNNAPVQQDNYLSGYAVSSCCGYLPDGSKRVPEVKEACCGNNTVYTLPTKKVENKVVGGRENYSSGQQCGIVSPVLAEFNPQYKSIPITENYEGGNQDYTQQKPVPGCGIKSPVLANYNPQYKSIPIAGGNYVENYQQDQMLVMPNAPGMVNTSCGYNPSQVANNLPSNLAVGNCQQDPRLSQYNKNLFTQTVVPGVYTTNQVNEGINANMGISFQQQFEPVTCENNEFGTQYILHDPRIVDPNMNPPPPREDYANLDNVYDPRFYGYGTSYRSYNDKLTGQTRFYYDDVNAIKFPNYIVRSKVDHLPYSDSYGPIKEGEEFGNVHNPNIRQLVQDDFLRNSLQFRNDLTERRMSRINSEAWQKRQMPLGPRQV